VHNVAIVLSTSALPDDAEADHHRARSGAAVLLLVLEGPRQPAARALALSVQPYPAAWATAGGEGRVRSLLPGPSAKGAGRILDVIKVARAFGALGWAGGRGPRDQANGTSVRLARPPGRTLVPWSLPAA
jgi:hypothetical protein